MSLWGCFAAPASQVSPSSPQIRRTWRRSSANCAASITPACFCRAWRCDAERNALYTTQQHRVTGRHQTCLLQFFQDADVIGPSKYGRVLVRPGQSGVLHHKFDIDDTAGILLDIERHTGLEGIGRGAGKGGLGAEVVAHLGAHLTHFAAQLAQIAGLPRTLARTPSNAVATCLQPTSTRARTRAWCSQVQASLCW